MTRTQGDILELRAKQEKARDMFTDLVKNQMDRIKRKLPENFSFRFNAFRASSEYENLLFDKPMFGVMRAMSPDTGFSAFIQVTINFNCLVEKSEQFANYKLTQMIEEVSRLSGHLSRAIENGKAQKMYELRKIKFSHLPGKQQDLHARLLHTSDVTKS